MKKGESFSEDLFYFFGEHTIHLEIFCFKHSGRFIVPHQTALLSYGSALRYEI